MRKSGVRSKYDQGQTRGPNHPNPATDSQNAPAAVADPESADPAVLQQELAAQKDVYLRLAADFDNGDKVFRPAKVIVNDLSHSPGVRHAG